MPQPPEYGARPGPSVEQVQMQVQGVRGIMQENVDVMLANIDATELLLNTASAAPVFPLYSIAQPADAGAHAALCELPAQLRVASRNAEAKPPQVGRIPN